jgi:hypothetical protein
MGAIGRVEMIALWIVLLGLFLGAAVLVHVQRCDFAQLSKDRAHLINVLHQHERNAKIYQQNEIFYESSIEKLKQEISFLRTAPSNEDSKLCVKVPPDGNEVFLPRLNPGRVYQITISGTSRFSENQGWLLSPHEAVADALYRTDRSGNFVDGHNFLSLNGMPVRRFIKGVPSEAMPEVDREAHLYKFRIDGCAERISACFSIKSPKLRWGTFSGFLTLTAEGLPAGTPSPAAAEQEREVAREKAKETARVANEALRLAEGAAKERAARRNKLDSLRQEAHFESHFFDLEFQHNFAKRDPREILATRATQWRKQYAQFMQDIELKTLAEAEAPQVIDWLEARVKIQQLAERYAIAPVQSLSAKKVRDAMVQEKATQYDSLIAGAKLKGKKIAEAEAAIDGLNLDESHKEGLKTDLAEQIRYHGEEPENGNGKETL